MKHSTYNNLVLYVKNLWGETDSVNCEDVVQEICTEALEREIDLADKNLEGFICELTNCYGQFLSRVILDKYGEIGRNFKLVIDVVNRRIARGSKSGPEKNRKITDWRIILSENL